MPTDFVELGPKAASATILLAHGAGAPMDAPGMTMIAEALTAQNLRVVRFEFAYMAQRRTEGSRKPPPRADKLNHEYLSAIEKLQFDGPLIIGGKSMGGRVASMIADDLFAAGRIAGLLCVGYPFHPIGKPDKLRTQHLKGLKTPTLICQGMRDQFGTKDEVSEYDLSPSIQFEWFNDGDHDLKPRKRIFRLDTCGPHERDEQSGFGLVGRDKQIGLLYGLCHLTRVCRFKRVWCRLWHWRS